MTKVFVLVFLSMCLLLNSNTVLAEIYSYIDESGTTVFTSDKPDPTRYQVINHGCFNVCRTGVNWARTPLKPNLYATEVNTAAKTFGVDKALVRAIIHAESWFKNTALSKAGAQGLMQLMPATQQRFGVVDPNNPQQNVNAGVEYIAWLMKEFDQNLESVICAYNAGENAVRRHNGIPPFNETKEYLRRIKILHQRYTSLNSNVTM